MALSIVRSAKEIDSFHGRSVKIIGIYNVYQAQKGARGPMVAAITIQDGTDVIIRYSPDRSEVSRYENRTVGVIGTIYRSCPDETQQWLVAPHLMEIQVLDEDTEEMEQI